MSLETFRDWRRELVDPTAGLSTRIAQNVVAFAVWRTDKADERRHNEALVATCPEVPWDIGAVSCAAELEQKLQTLRQANPHLLRPDLLDDPNYQEAVEETRRFFESHGVAE